MADQGQCRRPGFHCHRYDAGLQPAGENRRARKTDAARRLLQTHRYFLCGGMARQRRDGPGIGTGDQSQRGRGDRGVLTPAKIQRLLSRHQGRVLKHQRGRRQ